MDPSPVSGGAIIFQVDNPDFDNNAWRDITVRNNTIVYLASSVHTIWPPAIKFGVSSSAGQPLNTVFDTILVEGNKIYIDPGIGDGFSTDLGLMAFWTSNPIHYFNFDNTTVRDNTAYYNGTRNVLGARAYAQGDNWVASNNVKVSYQPPPPIPDPLAEFVSVTTSQGNGADARTVLPMADEFRVWCDTKVGYHTEFGNNTQKSWLRFDLAAAGITEARADTVTLKLEMIESGTGAWEPISSANRTHSMSTVWSTAILVTPPRTAGPRAVSPGQRPGQ